MFKLIIIIFLFCSCSSSEFNRYSTKEISKTFQATYNATWDAVLSEVSKYSLKNADKESGIIITDTVSTFEKLSNFNYTNSKVDSYFYINISSASKNELSTTVSVSKFSVVSGTNKIVGTDYTDENLILYRTRRNLILKRKKFDRAS